MQPTCRRRGDWHGALRGTASITTPLSLCELCRPCCIPARAPCLPVAYWLCSILTSLSLIAASCLRLLTSLLHLAGRAAVAALAL